MSHKRRIFRRILGMVAGLFWRLIYSTLRVEVIGNRPKKGALICFWHGEQLCLYAGIPPGKAAAPVSLSRDGELQVGLLKVFGVSSVRGSSSLGSVRLLRNLVRIMRTGTTLLMAVDGPRGPIHEPKPGAFYLSRTGGSPVVPVVAVAKHAYQLSRPWDKMLVPLPFSRVKICFGSPLHYTEFSSIDDMMNAFIVAMARLRSDTEDW